MGFIIYGNEDSPVVPLMLYMPAKIGYVLLQITDWFLIRLKFSVLLHSGLCILLGKIVLASLY